MVRIDLYATDQAKEAKEGQNRRFDKKMLFANTFFSNKKTSEIFRTPSCFSRRDASTFMHVGVKKLYHSLTRGQGHMRSRVTQIGHVAYQSMRLSERYTFGPIHFSISILSKVIGKNSFDLI